MPPILIVLFNTNCKMRFSVTNSVGNNNPLEPLLILMMIITIDHIDFNPCPISSFNYFCSIMMQWLFIFMLGLSYLLLTITLQCTWLEVSKKTGDLGAHYIHHD